MQVSRPAFRKSSMRATDLFAKPCSIAGLAMPERGDGLPLRRRIDMEIDHADPAFLERALHVRGPGHRADPDGALRLGKLGDVRRGVLQAQPDPAVLGLAPAR